ncbi:hypothetical protein TanjilG_01908 [Lupinus angustifolius]|nr:hypothetical protein TanjilG_01908 [Lupinus angustifolius]
MIGVWWFSFSGKIVVQNRQNQKASISMSANEVKTSMKEGALACILLASLEGEEKPEIKDLRVICEYPDVFPDDIPSLPLMREVEF